MNYEKEDVNIKSHFLEIIIQPSNYSLWYVFRKIVKSVERKITSIFLFRLIVFGHESTKNTFVITNELQYLSYRNMLLYNLFFHNHST